METYFAARLDRARGRGRAAVARLWVRSAVDVVRTAMTERSERRTRRRGNRAWSLAPLAHDGRYAVRRLAGSPLFALSSILILGISIGLNTAVFSVVDTMLLRPPPLTDPHRIVHIYQDADEGGPGATSYPAYLEMAAMRDVFAAVAASSPGQASWDDGAGVREVAVEFATSGYLDALGLSPARGRWFGAEHDVPGAEMVAVVSHHAWRTKLAADPGVLGRRLRLNNRPVTVIGVGPVGYNGEAGALVTDVWLSISSTPLGGPYRVANLERREDHWYVVKARLAAGVGVSAARGAMNALAADLAARFPDIDRGRGISVYANADVRLHPTVDSQLVPAAIGLVVIAALILILACSNLANLLLVRGSARQAEMAVRLALGAGRGGIVRLLLLEAILLSALGTAVGLVLATWALRIVGSIPLPVYGGGLDVGVDYRVLLFSIVVSAATALLFGLMPALRATRGDVASVLGSEGRGHTHGRRVSVLRSILVSAQVAVSFALVVGAGMFARSLANTLRVDPGVAADRIVVVGMDLSQAGIEEEENGVVAGLLLERLSAVAGVESVALTTRLPLQRGGTTTQVVDGYSSMEGTGTVEVPFAFVSRDYFRTMGIAASAGRTFEESDRSDSRPVIIVSETAARMFWNGSAAGGRIRRQSAPDSWREVVGVVADVKVSSLDESPTPMIYFPAEQSPPAAFSLVVRTAGDPQPLMPALRSAVHDVRPTLPITRLEPLDRSFGASLGETRAATAMIAAFSMLALLLASIGVHAVVAFTVSQRRAELSIRAALGAARMRLVLAVVRESMVAVAAGMIAGLLLAAVISHGLASALYGVPALHAGSFAAAAFILLGAAACAAALPALRAARAEPAAVLR
jgi:predicted permease